MHERNLLETFSPFQGNWKVSRGIRTAWWTPSLRHAHTPSGEEINARELRPMAGRKLDLCPRLDPNLAVKVNC